MRSGWIYSEGFYLLPRAGSNLRIFGFYATKQTKIKKERKEEGKGLGRFFGWNVTSRIQGVSEPS